ncbi:hypothetical protein DB346_20130 [Verrucomicrobia bacterium LW23]|nr:hypothetical protein DB346_20130 [Verrucomicrobia bacterium LW23]
MNPTPVTFSSPASAQARARIFAIALAIAVAAPALCAPLPGARAQEIEGRETAPSVHPAAPRSPVRRPAPTPADPAAQPAEPPTAPVAQPAAPAATPAGPADAESAGPAPAGAPPAPFSPGGTIQVTRPADGHFERAKMLYTNKQFPGAIKEFASFLRDYPKHDKRDEALFFIAQAFTEAGQANDAVASYTLLIEQFPNSIWVPAAQINLGSMYFRASEYEKAIASLTPALKGGDAAVKVPARYMIGVSLLRTGKFDDGRTVLNELITATPPSEYAAWSAMALAEAAKQEGKLELSLSFWRQCIKLPMRDKGMQAQCAVLAGGIAYDLKQYKDAESLFRTGLELDPGTIWTKAANSRLLNLYVVTRRWDDLLELARPTTERFEEKFLDESRPGLIFNVANASFQLKKYAAAIMYFDRFLADYPKERSAPTAGYQRLLAHINAEPKTLPAKGAEFLEAWPESPWTADVQVLLAQYYSKEGDFEKALPYWEKVSSKPPAGIDDEGREKIAFELSRCFIKLSKWAQAADAFRAFVRDFPKSKLSLEARESMAVSLQNDRKLDEALEAWKVVVEKAPAKSRSREQALKQTALLLAHLGKRKEAVPVFDDLLTEFPNNDVRAIAAFNVGAEAFDAKDYKKAENMLTKAREWDPAEFALGSSSMLAFISFTNKDVEKTIANVKAYEAAAKARTAKDSKATPAPLQAALYFWIAQESRKAGRTETAAYYYSAVAAHPSPGQFRNEAWLALAEEQYKLKQFKTSVASFEKYQTLEPKYAQTPQVVLGLAKAQLAAGEFEEARKLAENVMSTDADGPNNAIARLIQADSFFGLGDFDNAAKAYKALALVHDDPEITPKAMRGAVNAFQKLGDTKEAAAWKDRLKKRYPRAEGA